MSLRYHSVLIIFPRRLRAVEPLRSALSGSLSAFAAFKLSIERSAWFRGGQSSPSPGPQYPTQELKITRQRSRSPMSQKSSRTTRSIFWPTNVCFYCRKRLVVKCRARSKEQDRSIGFSRPVIPLRARKAHRSLRKQSKASPRSRSVTLGCVPGFGSGICSDWSHRFGPKVPILRYNERFP